MYTVCIDACRGSYYTNPLSMITDIVCVCVGIQCTCVHCVFVRQVIAIAVKIIGEKNPYYNWHNKRFIFQKQPFPFFQWSKCLLMEEYQSLKLFFRLTVYN